MEQTDTQQPPISKINNETSIVNQPNLTKKKLFLTLAIVFVLATVLVVFMGVGGGKTVEVVNAPATNTENDMSGWKTYTYEVAGFSISYPNSWEQITKNVMTEINDENGKRIGVQGSIGLKGEDSIIIIGFGGGFGGASCSYKGGILENFQVGNQTTYLCTSIPSDPKYIYTENEYKYSWTNGCSDCGGLIANNGDDYFISISSNRDNLPQTIQKILSTFEFTDNVNKTSTAIYTEETISLIGIVKKLEPKFAEDYSYELVLEKPYYDELQATGQPYINSVPLLSTGTKIDLNTYFGKKTEIQGVMAWGYSESRYLQVKEIKEL
jgi:hypothetical protein